MSEENLYHNIALTMVPDIGPVMAKYLISYCGSAEAVFNTSKKALSKIPGIGIKSIEKIAAFKNFGHAAKQMEFLQKTNSKAVTFHDAEYPQRLRNFEASPLVLYYKGEFNFNHPRTVAIIGTRKPTELGKVNCERIIDGLQSYGVQVVSGLAFGIDTCAHKRSVEKDIETVGVMGHGLDLLYPASNKKLVAQMMERGGIVTEFPTNTKPNRENFPMRNRIIAAMSDAIIVVESKRRGGSIITTEFANSYNKDVFAVPGRTTDPNSEGCNKLIKQHKANLLESAADIGYIMRWDELDAKKVIQTNLFVDLDTTEKKISEIIKEKNEITVDELNYVMKMSPSELASNLLGMEFKGVIRSLPGKKYMLN